MNELISLAKENAFVVIGLLLVTIYLQDRIHDETSTLRQEMRDEFTGVREEMRTEFSGFRQEMADFGEQLAPHFQLPTHILPITMYSTSN